MYYFLLKKTALLYILLLSAVCFSADNTGNKSRPTTWHKKVVTGTLQQKLENISPNSIIVLPKGVYQGPIHIKIPGITIKGEPGAVIDGAEKGSVVVVEASNVTLQGLTLRGSGKSHAQTDAGVSLRSSENIKIINNRIEDCLFGIDVHSGKNILIKGNFISSKSVSIALRGDAIRLWNVKGASIEDNKWQFSRDAVLWYSKDISFKGNEGSDSRYSIHSMYSEGVKIQNNKFTRNQVGIFLMYGSNFLISRNIITKSLGPTGMGIGIKESSNIIVQENTINYSSTGLLVDNSPYKPGTRNWIFSNTFSFNGRGILLSNDMRGGVFKRNSFIGNLEDVVTENRKGSNGKWEKNYWDKYLGFDENNDKVGDQPFILKSYGESLRGSNPKTALFYGSPLVSLVSLIEKIINIGEPMIVLIDKHPHILKD